MIAGVGDPEQVARSLDALRVVEELRAFGRLTAADHGAQAVVGAEAFDLVAVFVGHERYPFSFRSKYFGS